jgi:hypothetical protein
MNDKNRILFTGGNGSPEYESILPVHRARHPTFIDEDGVHCSKETFSPAAQYLAHNNLYQCCGSGFKSALTWFSLIRILSRICNADPDPGARQSTKIYQKKKLTCSLSKKNAFVPT